MGGFSLQTKIFDRSNTKLLRTNNFMHLMSGRISIDQLLAPCFKPDFPPLPTHFWCWLPWALFMQWPDFGLHFCVPLQGEWTQRAVVASLEAIPPLGWLAKFNYRWEWPQTIHVSHWTPTIYIVNSNALYSGLRKPCGHPKATWHDGKCAGWEAAMKSQQS